MVKNCAVPFCKNRADKSLRKGITFHLFPKHPKKRQSWLLNIRRLLEDSTSPVWQPSASSVICSEHFEESCFRSLNGKRLVRDEAIPTIFPYSPKSLKTVNPLLVHSSPMETDFPNKRVNSDGCCRVKEVAQLSDTIPPLENKVEYPVDMMTITYPEEPQLTEAETSEVEIAIIDGEVSEEILKTSDFFITSEETICSDQLVYSTECLSQIEPSPGLTSSTTVTSDTQTIPVPNESTDSHVKDRPCQVTAKKDKDLSAKTDTDCHEGKVQKEYRGPSKKAKLTITLFKKAMRLSELGLDVFLVVHEANHCPTYWGTEQFTDKFVQSKPLISFSTTNCYNAKDCYDFVDKESKDKSFDTVVDTEMATNLQDFQSDTDDHTYSLSNNTKDGNSDINRLSEFSDSSLNQIFLVENPHYQCSDFGDRPLCITDRMEDVLSPVKCSLSEKIDQLISLNEKICSACPVLPQKQTGVKRIFQQKNRISNASNSCSDHEIDDITSPDDVTIGERFQVYKPSENKELTFTSETEKELKEFTREPIK